MRVERLLLIPSFFACCMLFTGCPSSPTPSPSSKAVVVTRSLMSGSAGRQSLLYRNDPKCSSGLLLCPVQLAGDIGEDPYSEPDGVEYAGPLMAFRFDPATSATFQPAADQWLSANTPVGHAYLSRIGGPGDVGNTATSRSAPLAGQYPGFVMWSPNDPSSQLCTHDGFGGSSATHYAILSGSTRDRPGVIPGTGGALKGPYYVQVFRSLDGVQVGPTRVLEFGEETLFEPTGGWTYDGRFIVLHYTMTGHVWIIPTPEVPEAQSKK